jgi:hypothetical protein
MRAHGDCLWQLRGFEALHGMSVAYISVALTTYRLSFFQ